MKKINQLLVAFLFLGFCSCEQKTEDTVKEEEEQVIEESWTTLEEPNYSIAYPNNWSMNQSKQMGTEFFILSELTGTNDQFSENVNLMIQDLSSQDMTLDYYIEISVGQIKRMVTDFELLIDKRINDSEKEYHKFLYNGTQGIHKLTIEQYAWMVNKKAYVLTFTSAQAEYESYKNIGEKILNSFVIKE